MYSTQSHVVYTNFHGNPSPYSTVVKRRAHKCTHKYDDTQISTRDYKICKLFRCQRLILCLRQDFVLLKRISVARSSRTCRRVTGCWVSLMFLEMSGTDRWGCMAPQRRKPETLTTPLQNLDNLRIKHSYVGYVRFRLFIVFQLEARVVCCVTPRPWARRSWTAEVLNCLTLKT